jgi:outer membrane lipoprotein LolB
MTNFRWFLIGRFLALLMLSGCAVLPQPKPSSSVPSVELRSVQVLNHSNWQFKGRIAVKGGGNNGSGRINWEQQGDHFSIRVIAPVTGKTWMLSGDDKRSHLEGGDHGSVWGDDAEVLLQNEVGWAIPLQQVRDWVRGIPSSPDHAQYVLNPQGQINWLNEKGWRIEYQAWALEKSGFWMPRRMVASRSPHEIRLAVDRWVLDVE